MKDTNKTLPKTLFHYTSFEKFKCIIQYGTMRFKLSTQSNDLLDTNFIIDLMRRVDFFTENLDATKIKLLEFLFGYFRRPEYSNSYKSYVACFTEKEDSRLLWDTYTINRPPNGSHVEAQYNGICIGFNQDKIRSILQNAETQRICNSGGLSRVYYREDQQVAALNFFAKNAFDIYDSIKNDPDQSQNIVPTVKTGFQLDFGGVLGKPNLYEFTIKKSLVEPMFAFINEISKIAPYFKHEFWEEEEEYRATLYRHISQPEIGEYIDLPISNDLIDYLILGPCFTEIDANELNNVVGCKLDFNNLKQVKSRGSGVIVMR